MQPSIRILLVEDDPLVILTVEDALKDGGFVVFTAADGASAVRLLEASDADYRALVTDVNLSPGGLTGWDVARRARELRSDVPVVYTTGEAADDWTAMGVPNSVLVPKPFAPAQIITALEPRQHAGSLMGTSDCIVSHLETVSNVRRMGAKVGINGGVQGLPDQEQSRRRTASRLRSAYGAHCD